MADSPLPPDPDPATALYYEDVLRRARLRSTLRRAQRRDAQARLLAAVSARDAVNLSAVEQSRRGRG